MNKDIMRAAGFGAEVEMVNKECCPTCCRPIVYSEFKDELSRREFHISGMCQECQDETFNGEEDEEDGLN